MSVASTIECCFEMSLAAAMRRVYDSADAGMSQRQSQQQPPIEHNLPCTLEELYKGSTRKMKISRTVHNAAGRPERISEILSIDIKPGWKKGTRITFPEKGESACACLCSVGSVEAYHEAYPVNHTIFAVEVVKPLRWNDVNASLMVCCASLFVDSCFT